MKKIVLIILIIFTCTGCYNYRELNELGIISAIGISKEDDNFVVDMQLINIMEAGDVGITESPITVISGKGNTITEAVRSMNLKSSKIFFSSNIEYVILDKSIIKDELDEVLDFLARDTKLSLNFLILTSTSNTPKEILSVLSEFDINSASNLTGVIKLSEERYGVSFSVSIRDYLDAYLSNGINSVIPNIYINGDIQEGQDTDTLKESNSNNYVALKNLVTFDSEGNVIELSDEESYGYNFIKNHITNATISCECDGGYFSVETLESKVDIKDKLKNDKLDIKGEVSGTIVFYGCNGKLDDEKVLKDISSKLENKIEDYIKASISLAKKNKIDYIGIGNYIYKNNTKYFDFKNKDWDKDGLSNIDFDVSVKVNLFKQGNLKGDVKSE